MLGSNVDQPTDGVLITRMLDGQRVFLQNIYSLMRLIQGEVVKRGWILIKHGGYGVTRNGVGRGLDNFASADWVVSHMGIAFVEGVPKPEAGTTSTPVPETGLKLLVFQVRWLQKSPEEPVVWHAQLLVRPDGAAEPKWEQYQNVVLAKLEPDPERRDIAGRTGHVRDGRFRAGVAYSGSYVEVPVTELKSPEDVIKRLIEPALEKW